MGLALLRYCLIGLAVLLCLVIGLFHQVPPLQGLIMVLILVLIGIFFQNEKQLSMLSEIVEALQKR